MRRATGPRARALQTDERDQRRRKSASSEFDLRALLEALNAQGVRFVVIGGVAVGAHGYVRGTEDLDLVPDPDPANLDRLTEALAKLEIDSADRRRNAPSIRAATQGSSAAAETSPR